MAVTVKTEAVAAPRLRYPGVRSFEERDQVVFRGRKAATDELLLRVLSVRLLLQFAPSGVGKTSLLTAGLFPRLRPYDYFPFVVRLNETGESLLAAVRRSLKQAAREYGLVDPIIPPQADSLFALLQGTQLWSSELLLLTPVLVFDQFEEVFSLRDTAFRTEVARQLGDFGGGTAPPAKFIISLREEYLGKLEEFSAHIPELFRERLRLSPLSADEAREAIVEPAALPGVDWASPPFGYTDDALALIIDFIDGTSDTVKLIETLTLQVVCNRAEALAIGLRAEVDPITLTVQSFGGLPGLERLVRDYYQKVLDRITHPGARHRAQRMFEEGLLDPAGKRLMLEQGEIEREYNLDEPTLDKLVASSLLRREPRNESVFYEISHDRLTDTIAKLRKPRLPRWVKPTLAVGALVLTLAIISWWQQRELTEQARTARVQAEYAVGQLLSENLVARLREAGLSDALRQILERTREGATRDDHANGLASVLQWRHAADIERDHGTLEKARQTYVRALTLLNGLPAVELAPAQGMLLAEHARIVTALAGLSTDAGEPVKAITKFVEAQRLWDLALNTTTTPRSQELLDAADSRISYANALIRTGDYDEVERQALAAARLASRVWSTAYDGRYGTSFDANFDIGRSIQIFADAALSLSSPRSEVELAEAAVKLARESVRLRPLSFQARKQFGTAIANRFALKLPISVDEWNLLRNRSRRQFADLGQTDPDNLRMRREKLALELAISEIVTNCLDDPSCRKNTPDGAAESARTGALEATGALRRLAAADPANLSLLLDVSWGLRVQSRLNAIDGATAASLVLLDEAIAIEAKVPLEDGDVQWHWVRASNLIERAKLAGKTQGSIAVKTGVDAAFAEIDRTPGDTLGRRFGRINLLESAIPVLRNAGLVKEAEVLNVQRNALTLPGNGPRRTSYDAALRLNDQAVQLTNAINRRDTANGMDISERIESLHAEAVSEYPFNAVLWANLGGARGRGADDQPTAAREAALRGAVAASWMARVLEPVPERMGKMYEAYRGLAMHLRDRPDTGAELLELTERGLATAKELAKVQPDSVVTLGYLADANLGVGFTRESQGVSGWDEAFRAAFLHGEHLARVEPDNVERKLWLGQNRSYLANLLDREKRGSEAAGQRQFALAMCRIVLAHPKANLAQRTQAKSCLQELVDAGAK
jgi:hypothetical protein